MGKQFRAVRRTTEREPIDDFDLITEVDADGEPAKTETFRLYQPADSAKLASFNLASRFKDLKPEEASEEQIAGLVSTAIDFLGACMHPAEHQRMYEILVSPTFGMDAPDMLQLCTWAMETVTARPTKRSTGSPRGRSTAGKKSTATSRRTAATTPSRSR
jgi:hypothetical protein